MKQEAKKEEFAMKLSTSDLGKIVHNVLCCTFDEKGCLHFNRFSRKQRGTYARESQDWAMKTLSSASATFDFITDSDYITLKFDLLPGSSKKMGRD